MTKHAAPWAFEAIYRGITWRLSHNQSTAFDHRIFELHERLTGTVNNSDSVMPDDMVTWLTGTNTLDGIACWFLLLWLQDRDWGIHQRTSDPAELAAIDKATALLRRWLEGDPPQSEDWRALLPDPQDPEARGSLSPVGLAAASLGRVFLNRNLAGGLDAAAQAFLGAPFPKRLATPFPLSLFDRGLYFTLGVCFFPLVLWRWWKDRPSVPLNPQYYPVLARALERLAELRWNPTDPEEAALFPQVVCGSPEVLKKYLAVLRRLHVEPDELADTEDILTRMSQVAREVGLQLADPRYMTGMSPRLLYSRTDPVPPVLLVDRSVQVYDQGQWYSFNAWLTGGTYFNGQETIRTKPQLAWKKLEELLDQLNGPIETPADQSRRIFYRQQPRAEYWAIELDWAGGSPEWDSEDEEPPADLPEKVFQITLRWGPWPFEGSLRWSPATQHQRRLEFPTRSAALAWYRREIERQLAIGFAECLPRLTYFSMQTRAVPVIEPRVVAEQAATEEPPEELVFDEL